MHTILPATTEHAATLLAIQRRAFQEEARRCETWDILPLTESLEAIVGHIETATVLAAWMEQRIVGAVRGIVADDVCTIRALCIEPEVQGRGIGTDLLRAIERAHPRVARFELLTNTVMESNVRFYQRLGYGIVELRHVSDKITLAFMSKPAA